MANLTHSKFSMNVWPAAFNRAHPALLFPAPGSWMLIPAFPFQCLKMPAFFRPEFDQKGQPSVVCTCM